MTIDLALFIPAFVRISVTFLLAFLVESMVEYIFGTPMGKFEKLKPYKWLLMYVAAGIGVFSALYYKLDIVALVPALIQQDASLIVPTPVGMVFTGLAIGRGANFVHDLVENFVKNLRA